MNTITLLLAYVAVFGNQPIDGYTNFTFAAETPSHVAETINEKRGLALQIDTAVLSFSKGDEAPIDTAIGLDWATRYIHTRLGKCRAVILPIPGEDFANEAVKPLADRKGNFLSIEAALAAKDDEVNPALVETSFNGWCHVARMTEKRAEIRGDKRHEYDIVFFGDSITHGFDRDHQSGYAVVTNRLPEFRCLNLGYGADQTQHLLWRGKGGELDSYTAKMFCLMIGTNNGRWGHTPKQIAEGVRAILDLIEAKHPESKIVLLPVFPRGRTAADPLRKKNAETSALIKEFVDSKTVFWLDFTSQLMEPDGSITKEMMPDALHPAAPGYEIWFRELRPFAEKFCGKGLGGRWGEEAADAQAGARETEATPDAAFEDIFTTLVSRYRAEAKANPGKVVVIKPLDASLPYADFVNRDLEKKNVCNDRIVYNDPEKAKMMEATPACLRMNSPMGDFGSANVILGLRKDLHDVETFYLGGPLDAKKFDAEKERTAYDLDLPSLLWKVRGGIAKGFKAKRVVLSLARIGRGDKPEDVLNGLKEIVETVRRDQPQAELVLVTYQGLPKALVEAYDGLGVKVADLKLKIVNGAWSCTLGDEDIENLKKAGK